MSQKQELPDHVWDLLSCTHSAISDAHELIGRHCDEPIEAVAIGDIVLGHLATAQAAIERIALTYSALSESNAAAVSESAMTEKRGTRESPLQYPLSCITAAQNLQRSQHTLQIAQ